MLLLAIIVFLLIPASRAKADGGPVVDPLLFNKLKEGQQIAVIKLLDKNTISVDLFVSILDQTGTSHDITFFVPLGAKAERFSVHEEGSTTFNEAITAKLDATIFKGYENDKNSVQMLFAGALLTNGIWFIPCWAPLLLSGCAAGSSPLYTYKTDSSEVSIYDINESTDINNLINTTGLDPSVKNTLLRVKGQQIAVVKLKTNPATDNSGATGDVSSTGEPGLHLSWTTKLVTSGNEKVYAYPLGTGTAWAYPIEMTRIYIISPTDVGITVNYPRLGSNSSGYKLKSGSLYIPRIADAKTAAYAIENVYTEDRYMIYGNRPDLIHIQRITYINSNAKDDIILSVKNGGPGFFQSVSASLSKGGMLSALVAGILVAIIFWILAWYFLAPRVIGGSKGKKFWLMSLTYIGWNFLLFIPGAFFYFIFSMGGRGPALMLLILVFGLASILIFTLRHLKKMKVSTKRAIATFALVTFVGNGAYLLFVIGYARLLGAI